MDELLTKSMEEQLLIDNIIKVTDPFFKKRGQVFSGSICFGYTHYLYYDDIEIKSRDHEKQSVISVKVNIDKYTPISDAIQRKEMKEAIEL